MSTRKKRKQVKQQGANNLVIKTTGGFIVKNILVLILVLLLGSVFGQAVKANQSAHTKYQTDRPGNDFAHFTMPDPGEGILDMRENQCIEACFSNSSCVAWTYVLPNTFQGPLGNCWLKDAVSAEVPCEACRSGTIGDVKVDRPGGDYYHFYEADGKTVTPQICNSICLGEERCLAWSFNKATENSKAVCWLKDSVPEPVACDICTSGYFKIEYLR